MNLDQVNPDFNDAIQVYYPSQSLWQRALHRLGCRIIPLALSIQRAVCGGQRIVNERIVEYSQILRWLPDQGTVLDVGCVSSRLPLQLASMGYTVHGIDVRPYPLACEGFSFHRADVLHWKPPSSFDLIICVSTIEHFGLGRYGDSAGERMDHVLVRRLGTWMRPGGRLLVTVPFGRSAETSIHRVYDTPGLTSLFADFARLDERYFKRDDFGWHPCAPGDLSGVDPLELPVRGVACLKLQPAER